MIGAIDDHRVGVGNIQPRFDDRRAHQQIDAVLDEVAHHVFELMLVHLAVADADARLGNQRAQMARDITDVLDAVVHEEHLTAAIEFAQNDFAHEAVVEMRNERANRLPIGRWRLNHRQVANPEHRHVQRARNRRRGQRQHLDQLAHRLHPLLVGDAETMLLVDYEQTRASELRHPWSRRCVPMTISTLPCATSSITALFSLASGSATPSRFAPDNP